MKTTLYIELDALLDTRIATISQFSQEAAIKCLKNDNYFNRENDDFELICDINKTEFNSLYKKRNLETLKLSILTPMAIFLNQNCVDLEKKIDNTPSLKKSEIIVNYFPYVIPENDLLGLEKCIEKYAGNSTPVRLINEPPKNINPKYCKENLSGLILYNFNEWFEANHEELLTTRIPNVTMIVPAIYHSKLPDKTKLRTNSLGVISPIFEVKIGLIEYINLEPFSIDHFCIYKPIKN